ncbi:ankyrin repeat domain-containing protein [Altererythrobacter sp. MTPC7]|uniref:ankyrin repeat domain-containing protein n=1 Tax=Altererythrobacter sp. MTPC7 TaxID=3056567 RepID=UPI0036F349CB
MMGHGPFAKIRAGGTALAALSMMAAGGAALPAPAAAQALFSDGYAFLKLVKDRDGQKVTNILDAPGQTIINTRDITTGDTAVHIVAERRDAVWIEFLTDRGANPNIANVKGVTPIMISANLGHIEGVEKLIEAGAQVDVASSAGETPLIGAVHRRDVALVRLLLEHGANPDRNDNSGRSARNYAEMTGSRQLLDEFIAADEAREAAGEQQSYGPSF